MSIERFRITKSPVVRGALGAGVMVLAALGPVSCMGQTNTRGAEVDSNAPTTAQGSNTVMHFFPKLKPGETGFDLHGSYSGEIAPELVVKVCDFTAKDVASIVFDAANCSLVADAEGSALVWANEGKLTSPVFVTVPEGATNAMVVVTAPESVSIS